MSDNIIESKFLPLPGMDWNDLSKWVLQCVPECFSFIDSTLNTLCSLSHKRLPVATFDGYWVLFSWTEKNRSFVLKVHSNQYSSVDLEWIISDENDKELKKGEEKCVPWFPKEFIVDFRDCWNDVVDYEHTLLGACVAIFAVVISLFVLGMSV